jgi:uncharacterized membrane protein
MSDLVVIEFPSESRAEAVRQRLLDMQDYLIDLGDAVIAVKQPDGRIKLNQLFDPTRDKRGVRYHLGYAHWHDFPNALAGPALGAASGALAGALTDVGISDQFAKDVAPSLQSGNAALFLLIRQMPTTDKILDQLKGVGGKVLRTSFDHTKEEALRAALAGATQRKSGDAIRSDPQTDSARRTVSRAGGRPGSQVPHGSPK